MKLSENTLETLKNFSDINNGLLLQKGNLQKTIDDKETLMAEATLEEEITARVGIYDLPQFLGLLKMMNNPNIELSDKTAFLDDGELQFTYRFCDPNLIKAIPEAVIEIAEPDAKFTLLGSKLQKLLKIADSMNLPNLIVKGGPEGVSINISEKDNDLSHSGFTQVSTDPVKEFTAVWLRENLKVIPDNYNVTLSLAGVSILENESGTRKYYVPLQV